MLRALAIRDKATEIIAFMAYQSLMDAVRLQYMNTPFVPTPWNELSNDHRLLAQDAVVRTANRGLKPHELVLEKFDFGGRPDSATLFDLMIAPETRSRQSKDESGPHMQYVYVRNCVPARAWDEYSSYGQRIVSAFVAVVGEAKRFVEEKKLY